jgi:CubicO group peptidase (beta-lactamase class C family)
MRWSSLAVLPWVFLGCSTSEPSVDTTHDASPSLDASAPDDLSETFAGFVGDRSLPGMAGAVWKEGRLVAIGAAGVRKVGDPTPVTIDDRWHLGSDTKAMTATLIGLYVDRGKIHFEDTVASLFQGETVDPGYANVSVEQLLQHRGGAPGTMPDDIWSQMWADGDAPDARVKAVRALLARPPAQAAGTYVYSNAGYMIAGVALERITGKPWEQMLREDLFTPLGMESCGFGPPSTSGEVDQPWAHKVSGGVATPVAPGPQADNPPSLGPAGTVHCALKDWGKFLAVHLEGARGFGTFVSTQTMARLQTPPPGADYACGWIVVSRPWAGGTALTHSGSNTMWYATAWLAPAKDTVFTIVTNRGDDIAAKKVDSAFGPLIERYAP